MNCREAAGKFAPVKIAVAIALLFLAACGGAWAAASPRVEKVRLDGKEYVRLDQWARANSFSLKWLSGQELLVSKSGRRLQFTTDSKRMLLDGITVLLSEPVRAQNGLPYLANLDLTTVINPILYPPRGRARSQVRHICLDPGHGGKDIGKSNGGEHEKKYALLLAQELGAQLRKAGYTVSYTRTTDTTLDLPDRPEIARRKGADLFVSLHFNSAGAGGSGVQGAEVYCMTPRNARSTNDRGEGQRTAGYLGNANDARNMVLAYEIQRAIVREAGSEDRGVKRARFAVLRDAPMPSVLIEAGFMSNPAEARKIYSATWRRQMAQAIATGIIRYQKLIQP